MSIQKTIIQVIAIYFFMVLSDTLAYVTILGITVVFSAFSLADTEYRLIMKIIASLSWFIMGLTQFFFFGGSYLLAVPLCFFFIAVGVFFSFSIVTDFRNKKRDEIYSFMEG